MNEIVRLEGRGAGAQLALLRLVGGTATRVLGRGLQRTAWGLGRVFPDSNRALVRLPHGLLWLYLDDGYWSASLLGPGGYERDIDVVLRGILAGSDAYFLDCGANIGYWSIVASALLRDGVTAVEAAPWVADRLRENARLNGDRFTCVNAAVWDTANATVSFHTDHKHHADGRLVAAGAADATVTARVATTTLDDLVDEHAPEADRPVVIKLDVEGAEVPALQGGRRTLAERRPLLIYEDHGNEPSHLVTQLVLDLGLRVFHSADDGAVREITAARELDAVKVVETRGYNFFACSPESRFAPLLAEGTQLG